MSDETKPLTAEELAVIRERYRVSSAEGLIAHVRDQLQAHLADTVSDVYIGSPDLETAETIRRLLATVEALQTDVNAKTARVAQLEALMRDDIVRDIPWVREASGDYFCTYCGAIATRDQPSPHLASCVWVQAKLKSIG